MIPGQSPRVRGGLEMPVAESVRKHSDAKDRGAAVDQRYAVVVFAAVIVFAGVFILWNGRYGWFRGDEWGFLTSRDGASVNGLLSPHNDHWSTIPVIEWRLLFNIFGLKSYIPYQALILATHLVAAVLL